MISSVERAPSHGGALLVVDGLDETLVRKAEFAFKPSRAWAAKFDGLLGACCEVWNAGLTERRCAYEWNDTTVTVIDQFKEITHLRGERDDALVWGVQPVRSTLRRLDEAMVALFRRVGNGQKAGYPRFKSRSRFNTVTWDEPMSWSIDTEPRTLYVQGCGTVKLSKSAFRQLSRMLDQGGVAVTLTVTRRQNGKHKPGRQNAKGGQHEVFRATVGFKNVAADKTEPKHGAGSIVGGDRGVAVTLATSDGTLWEVPPFIVEARDRIADLQRQRARCKKGSRRWRQLNKRIAREHADAGNCTDNWACHTGKQLVEQYDVIALERLRLKNMTRSARGTKERPGTNVAAKQALNRRLQDAALGKLAKRVCVKAESAGRRVWLVPAAHTSTTCASCGHRDPTNRRARDLFICRRCGHTAHADVNASENIAAKAHNAEVACRHAGSPALVRPAPRMRRRNKNTGGAPPQAA